MVNNFETTGQIKLILVPLNQKLAELTNRNKSYSKKKCDNFLRLFFEQIHHFGRVDPSRFIKIFFPDLENYQSGGVMFSQNRRRPNLEGSQFCQSGGVLFFQSGGVLFFVNPEGYYFCLRT